MGERGMGKKDRVARKKTPYLGRIWDFRVQDDYHPGCPNMHMVTLKFHVIAESGEEANRFAQGAINYLKNW